MDITNLISNLGFPIAACIAMGWYVNNITQKFTIELKEIRKEHSEEIEEITKIVAKNTTALEKLIERIDRIDKDV